MQDAYLYSGLRTPFGRHAGALAPIRPDDLVAHTLRELVSRSGFAPDLIADVILGCTNQSGEDARNIARNALLLAGLPESVPGQTVNRLCASGLAAIVDASRAVRLGEGELYLAGGVESMSRAPWVMAKAESAWGREQPVFDSTIGTRFPNQALIARCGDDTMPQTADNVARELNLSRERCDGYALRSQQRYALAQAAGFFAGEIAPVEVSIGRKSPPRRIDQDEHPRPDTNAAALARLSPLFDGGVVTAGNASGINDGAVSVLVGNRAIGERHGVSPLVRLIASSVVGLAPRVMGLGPTLAIPAALQRAGLTLDQMDVIEINEAFAAQVLGCLQVLGLPDDDSRVNPNGGAIALGHPLGASGARLALTAARQLHRTGGRYAVVSLCIGVGQGMALVFERVD